MPKSFRCIILLIVSFLVFPALLQGAESTLLLRMPSIHGDEVAFVYAGDIWISNQNGDAVRRLTVNPGIESYPYFSPDGKWIAFSGNYDGNLDVYVVATTGGSPKRLTYHPGADVVLGWTPDGEQVLFRSSRASNSGRYSRFFTVPVTSGFPTLLPLPMAERGSYSHDGMKIAYTPIRDAFQTWKRYRGGRTTMIWLFDVQTSEKEEIPHENASDTNPIWFNDKIYFLSDRNRIMNLFEYDTQTKNVRQVTHHANFDVKYASADDQSIIYEQAGKLHVLNPSSGTTKTLEINVTPDLPYTRPHFVKAKDFIRNAEISPTGVRAVFEARGEIVTVPAEKGDYRNLTNTPGVNERFPAWSPDGEWIAYFSDASGEYQLMLQDQSGLKKAKMIPLKDKTFYYSPKWSPDSKKIAFTDKRLHLFFMDLDDKKPVLIDTDTYDHPLRTLDPVWSPDSKWIAYTKRLDNQFRAVFVYNIENEKSYQVSDGMSDAISASFSKDGKYLYFAASTNFGLNTGWLDMSSYERPIRRALYLVVLNSKDPSPFAPQSDEESVKEENEQEKKEETDKEKSEKKEKEVNVVIDVDNISQRILALPLPERNYQNIQSADDGKLFYLEQIPNDRGFTLHRFDMKERKSEEFLPKVFDYKVSHDGKKLLYQGDGDTYAIVKTSAKPNGGEGKLAVNNVEILVNPKAEWQQMFDEVWRIERDFFYDPNMHGADWSAIKEKYQPFIKYIGHRDDLNSIFADMLGELVVGHAYVGGGDMERGDRVSVGLLGVDYEIQNGYYLIKKIYTGENWNPELRAPLTEPGVDVSAGDYIISVNGQPLSGSMNIYRLFQHTADRQTVLELNSQPSKENTRSVTVVPVNSERNLRYYDWVEGNRRWVEQNSEGKVAYIYMPNTAGAGYTSFNRYYFSQLDHDAVIVDERFNGGGSVADYIVDMLDRPLLSYWATREGKVFSSPNASIFGPKVMIVNQYAGSGGDAMPQFFRRRNLGKLVGKRTWGGLVGIYDYPVLIDGGYVTAPRLAIFSPDNKWEVENVGVSPDVEVEMTPKLVIEGHDPQLEKALELVLEELKQNPVKKPKRPPYPNRVK